MKMYDFGDDTHIRIYILESLGENDIPTGSNLYNSILKYIEFNDSLNDAEIIKIYSKNDLIESFTKIKNNFSRKKIFPIIHIESHGNENELSLVSDTIKWGELYDQLIEINILLKNSLILILALCNGGYILKSFNPFKRCPFRLLLSTTGEIFEVELQNGFIEFYTTFFLSNQKHCSLINLNQMISDANSGFALLDMEERYDYFLNLNSSLPFDSKRINDIKNNLERDIPNFSKLSNEMQCEMIKIICDENHRNFISNKDFFMMNDLK